MRRLWTVGHSNRDWEAFLAILASARIDAVADVRRFAGSRRHPQFSGDTMALELPRSGIDYLPMPELGGRRPPASDSPNDAWRNASFRGYADYMATADFMQARAQLAQVAEGRRTAVMCAEALWWQCHRGLIADAFKADGWEVVHLLAAGRSDEHPYTGAARLVEGRLVYSRPPEPQGALFG
ncbi:DUF488 domain-containing protein [Lysobacter sp. A3-1-A15]|uniref:DUF488 domain-containing protein n=1 Tax=Novilysobacter viscosus TaxID=3098602 RepID=UPI002ED78B4F